MASTGTRDQDFVGKAGLSLDNILWHTHLCNQSEGKVLLENDDATSNTFPRCTVDCSVG